MPTKQSENKKESSKEIMVKEIAGQLSAASPALKESLGEKKFTKRIKKAAKLLVRGIKSFTPKKAAPAKSKPAAKKTKPKEIKKPIPAKKTNLAAAK